MLEHLREAGILGEEAVAGVDGVRAGDLAGGDQGRDIEVAVAGRGRADADALVGEAHMHGVGVGGRVHRHRGDAELFRGPQDAQGDLAPVGNEDLVEHRHYSMTNRGSPYSTGVPSSTKIAVTVPARGAVISLKVFMASTSSTLSPACDLGADLDEVLRLGRGLAIGGADHRREHGARMGRGGCPGGRGGLGEGRAAGRRPPSASAARRGA